MLRFVLILLVPTTECTKQFDPFIIGGQNARIENFPHAVFLSMKDNRQWVCGASVVNQRILLTAAHCLHDCLEKTGLTCQIDAYAGSGSLNTMQVLRSVALALLNEELPLGQGLPIKQVVLMTTFPKDLIQIQIAGWGIIDDTTRERSVNLKSAKQWIQPRELCMRASMMHPGVMCASNNNENNEPTSGDSGSAVVTSSSQQIALVSYRSGIDESNVEIETTEFPLLYKCVLLL